MGMNCVALALPEKLLRTLDCMNRGIRDKEAARELGLTIGSFRTYVDALKQHFATRDRFEVVQRARHVGIVQEPCVDGARGALLTRRERRYLAFLREGLTPEQMACFLEVTPAELDIVHSSALRKLGAQNDAQALRRAEALALLPMEGDGGATFRAQPRDIKILQQVAHGRSLNEIGKRVGISGGRICVRLKMMRHAWGARDNYELLAAAHAKGVLTKGVPLPPRPAPETLRRSYLRVLHLMNRGVAYADIAAELDLTPATVRTYAAWLYEYFGVHSQPELVAAARHQGLVPEVDATPESRRSGRSVFETIPTPRQLNALSHARLDRGPSQIARIWGTSAANADELLARARRALGVRTTREAVQRAGDLGLLKKPLVSVRVPFSRRQRQVLRLLAQGSARRDIAEALDISYGCACCYIVEMRSRVRARNDDELLDIASRLGIALREAHRVTRQRFGEVEVREAISLTPRQAEVAEALCRWRDRPHREIAERLQIKTSTVNTHARVLKERLNLRGTSRTEFAERFARISR